MADSTDNFLCYILDSLQGSKHSQHWSEHWSEHWKNWEFLVLWELGLGIWLTGLETMYEVCLLNRGIQCWGIQCCACWFGLKNVIGS